MKQRLRLLVILLGLSMLIGCSELHACVHADEPDTVAQQRDALWEKLLSARPNPDPKLGADVLTVTFIDVGQGDCTLLIAPDGKTMLVDAGSEGSYDAIAAVLEANHIDTLDVVVATHPHEDHIGSMDEVLNGCSVGTFCTISAPSDTDAYAHMIDALNHNGCPTVYPVGGESIEWSETCTVTVLNPVKGYEMPDDLNDASVVLRVKYGDTAVLLCGDAEALAEKRMLDTFPRSMLQADVLKLGHHGSASSTGYSFFLAVSPDCAVASCGAGNDYGHPHLETLSLLYDTRTALYRTDCDGTITFRLDGTQLSVETTRKELP